MNQTFNLISKSTVVLFIPLARSFRLVRALAIIILFLSIGFGANAQWVLINKNGGSPVSTAALEVRDTTRGILFPRLNTNQMLSISSTAGLLVYNTDSSAFYFNNGSGWASISSSGATQFAVPTGSIIPFGGDSADVPAGFFLCDGSALDTTSYSELYAAIGTAWGGSGSNFNIPDLRGRFIRGTDYGAGNDPDRASRTAINSGGNTGDEVGATQNDELKSHSHSFTGTTVLMNSGASLGTYIQSGTTSTNSTGGNETRPKNANVNYIICYSSSIAAAGTNSSVFQGSVAASQLPANVTDSTRIIEADGTAKVQVDGSDNILFTTSNSEAMRVSSSGFVGIGTNNPQKILHVEHNTSSGITTNRTSTSIFSGHTWEDSGTEKWFIGQQPNDSLFLIRSNGSQNLIGILPSGNFGIGTTNPLVPLHLTTGTEANLTSNSGFFTIGNVGGDNLVFDRNEIQARKNGSTSFLALQVKGGAISVHAGVNDVNQWAVFKDNGNLLLGDTVAANDHKLRVAGRALIDTLEILNAFSFPTNSGSNNQVLTSNGSGNATWQTPASGADNLGNHTATQNLKLDTFRISNDGDNEGISIATNGQVTLTPATTGAGNPAVFAYGDYRTVGQGTGYYLTNNLIGITGNNGNSGDMRFKTANTDRIRITSGGQVGIGTTLPSYTLDVAGDAMVNNNRFLVTDSAGNLVEFSGQQNATYKSYGAYIRTATNPPNGASIFRVLSQGGAERLRVEHNGFVSVNNDFSVTGDAGIGTTTPTQKLDVAGNVRADSLIIHDGSNSPTAGDVLTAVGTDGKAYWASLPSSGDNLGNHTATSNVQLNNNWLSNDGGNEGIKVANNGFTTISGTSNTVARVEQQTDGQSAYLEIVGKRPNFTSSNALARIDFRNYDSNLGGGTEYPLAQISGYNDDNTLSQGGLRFETNPGTGLTEAMVLTKNGELGIGISTPVRKLHLHEASGGNYLQFTNGNTGSTATSGLQIGISSNGTAFIIQRDTIDLHLRTNNTNRITVGGTGAITFNNAYTFPAGDGANNQVLTTNGSGSLIWQNAQGDNLGNHTATNNVQLNGNWLSNDGGNEGIRIANNGNVGIGTATTNAALQFDASENLRKIVLVQTANNVHEVRGFGTRAGELVYQVDATTSDHVFQAATSSANSTELMRIGGDGFVGIKTSNPRESLHVNSNNANTYVKITNSNTGQGNTDGFMIGNASNTAFIRQMEAADLHFRTSDINRMTIDKDGNVGIGTAVPLAPLTLYGGQKDNFLFEISNNSANQGIAWQNTGSNYTWNMYRDANQDFVIAGGSNASIDGLSNYFHIDNSTGNVGLGTTTPSGNLVVADSSADAAVYIHSYNASANTNPFVSFVNDGATKYSIGYHESSDLFKISTSSFGTNEFTMKSNGDIGIGTNSPNSKLHLIDSKTSDHVAMFQNSSTATGANGIEIQIGPNSNPGTGNNFIAFRDGDGTKVGEIEGNGSGAVVYNTTSDRRLKTNIRDYEGALETINQIQPRIYERKSLLGVSEIGFIAQELQEVLPQFVSGDSTSNVDEEPMMVNYAQLTPVLAASIKELHALIIQLNAEIAELKASNESLEEENSDWKTQLENQNHKMEELQLQMELIQKMLNEGRAGR